MNQQIFTFLKSYDNDTTAINRLIVSAFVTMNNLSVYKWSYLNQYIITKLNEDEYLYLKKFISILSISIQKITIENIIELFEFVISPSDKIVNGAVYTPQYIRNYIINEIVKEINTQNWSQIKIADISCGCGGFFITFTDIVHKFYGVSCYDLYKNTIYGVDIQDYSIERCKIILILYALENGEDHPDFKFNLYKGNSLNFDWNKFVENYNGFDAIIGNPPYVSSSKIPDESKLLLDRWSVAKTGKSDLYIPFFQIALENLKDNAILGYITVNNFYRSLNGRAFRGYMSKKAYDIKIIDFAAEQVFKKRSTYTCLCFIRKINNGCIHYIQSNSSKINFIKKSDYINILYNNVSDNEGWLLRKSSIASIISIIEQTGNPLGKCFNICNGFATLKNDIFILSVINEDSLYYYTITKDKKVFPIEKLICRDAIKPNILKSENQINDKMEKIIFPYKIYGSSVVIMDENELVLNYPYAYKYLIYFKQCLSKRDKGNREYKKWYAYGRSQAINIKGFKLLFPYISDKPYFVLTERKDLLFYNGYALTSDSIEELKVIRKILKSKIFWFYIKSTSKPYGGNYFALAKNYVKNFGVINLNESQKQTLLNLNDNETDLYLSKLYGINLNALD